MVVSFHFTKSQSRETGKCGVPSLASREAPHSGGSPPDSPRGGSLPSLGLRKGQEWRGRGRSDAIVSVHTSLRWRERRFCSGSREDNPREQLCPVGPGPAAAAHSGQHSSCPAAALSLRRRSLRTKMQAGPLSSRRTPLTASLPGPPPPWLSRKGQGGEICPTATQSYSPQALRAVPWTARGKRNPYRKRVQPCGCRPRAQPDGDGQNDPLACLPEKQCGKGQPAEK